MPDRDTEKEGQPMSATTPPRFGLAELVAVNPHLSPADILALWRWTGPSSRVH